VFRHGWGLPGREPAVEDCPGNSVRCERVASANRLVGLRAQTNGGFESWQAKAAERLSQRRGKGNPLAASFTLGPVAAGMTSLLPSGVGPNLKSPHLPIDISQRSFGV